MQIFPIARAIARSERWNQRNEQKGEQKVGDLRDKDGLPIWHHWLVPSSALGEADEWSIVPI